MGFMQKQNTGIQTWVKVETTHGTEFVSVADTSLFVRDSHTQTHPMMDAERNVSLKEV